MGALETGPHDDGPAYGPDNRLGQCTPQGSDKYGSTIGEKEQTFLFINAIPI